MMFKALRYYFIKVLRKAFFVRRIAYFVWNMVHKIKRGIIFASHNNRTICEYFRSQGAKIGEVGKTGNANYKNMQAHLHFEIRDGKEYLDPLKLLE